MPFYCTHNSQQLFLLLLLLFFIFCSADTINSLCLTFATKIIRAYLGIKNIKLMFVRYMCVRVCVCARAKYANHSTHGGFASQQHIFFLLFFFCPLAYNIYGCITRFWSKINGPMPILFGILSRKLFPFIPLSGRMHSSAETKGLRQTTTTAVAAVVVVVLAATDDWLLLS